MADRPRHISTIVKLSSPNINNVMLLGCVCTYCTVFMYSYTSETLALCYVRICTFTLGFTTVFGALFSKTWRVYRIFANKKSTRLTIKDRQLVGLVGTMLTAIAVFLLVRYIVDPLFIETLFLPNESYMSGNDAEIHPFLRRCVSRYESYFSWTINIIEGVLLVFGAFLSFETRKVRITALNDSRLIGFCLYNVIGMATIGLTLTLALETQVALVYGITSGFTTLGTTITQLIVFVPKIMAVYYPHHVEQGDEPTISRRVVSKSIISRLNVPGPASSTVRTTSQGPRSNSPGADNTQAVTGNKTPLPGTSSS